MGFSSEFVSALVQLASVMAPMGAMVAFLVLGALHVARMTPSMAEWHHDNPRAAMYVKVGTYGLLMVSGMTKLLVSGISIPQSESASGAGRMISDAWSLNPSQIGTLISTRSGTVATFVLGVLVGASCLLAFGRFMSERFYFDKRKNDEAEQRVQPMWNEKPKRMERVRLSDDGELVRVEETDERNGQGLAR